MLVFCLSLPEETTLKSYYFQILEYLREYMDMDKIIFLSKRTWTIMCF